ncbi:MAG TPA: beta-propeller fold lactonase family protein [Chthoniobacteraceae bacterium]|jgi:6-phosphogluconolactonase|nr:beta-propeller fold lactonase family protein [Chthoniobacteraceae bacterium]
MNRSLFSSLLLCALLASAHAQEKFHVYAPSPTSGRLLIVEATPTKDALELKMAEEVQLGFPVSAIAKNRTLPVLYLGPASGEEGNAKGAVVSLKADGSYGRHTEYLFAHPYAYLSLDRTGRFLLGVDYGKGFVDVCQLDETGTPVKRAAALNEGVKNAHCIITTPDNRFAYVSYVKETNGIFQYKFDSDSGKLTPLEPKNALPPEGTGPRHMAYHPSRPIVYFSNEQHLGVSAYDIEKSGALKLRQVCDSVGANESREGVSASDIVLTPDGRFLFTGIRGHTRPFDWIARYKLKDDGALEFLGFTPADKIPWGLALSPDSRYLLATAFDGATLMAWKIGETGDLAKAGSLAWEKNISAIVTR